MNNLKSITSLEGKKLSKSQINLLAKLEDKFNVKLLDNASTRHNDFSGVTCLLCPLAVTLFDFIIVNYRRGLVKGSTAASMSNPNAIPTAVWDSARHFFLAFWPDEYYKLID